MASTSRAYYNEIDPFAAAWLRELIKVGLIADGEVDERSIADVRPDDVRGFTQCHWFAGIGGWSYALRLAGWPDDRAVWTGSCPCQPFSSAGAQAGGHDPRDLWPVWFELVKECRPDVVFGEQVEAAIGHGWLDRLCDDMESENYAVGPCGLPSASVGAFDIRQRLWFVADACGSEWWSDAEGRIDVGDGTNARREETTGRFAMGRSVGELADTDGRQSSDGDLQRRRGYLQQPEDALTGVVADASSRGLGIDRRAPRHAGHADECEPAGELGDTTGEQVGRAGQPREDFWRAADWLHCADGKARPVEPGTFPLAHGIPARVGRLRGYGNAINPELAAAFIESYLEAIGDRG